tara:strand:- start:281 stop:505 length:225 start_codon:yes stop_codon:yes gene_type:complete
VVVDDAFGGLVATPENVSKNPKFEGVPKKTTNFCSKSDLRWGMEYIFYFLKINIFFTENVDIQGLRYRISNTHF